MAPIKKSTPPTGLTIDIVRIEQGEATYQIIGDSPLIMERFAEKAKRAILAPAPRMTTVEKAVTQKHYPRAEFADAAYVRSDGPTLLVMPCTAFKAAIMHAALRVPGARKTEIGELTHVTGEFAPIWGIPRLLMSGVRSADMAKTPDIRTRPAIFPWATQITIRYIEPNLTANGISNLVTAAGMICGIGGWRQQKGAGANGLFHICHDDEVADWEAIVASGGRDAQVEAMAAPVAYNDESADLLAWHDEEVERRHLKGTSAKRAPAKEALSLAAD